MLDQEEQAQVKKIIEDTLSGFLGSEKYLFQKNIQIFDARNIQLGRTNGTKLGTEGGATGQKIGFWGTLPVVQPSAISVSATQTLTGADTVDITKLTTDLTNLKTATNAILSALRDIGIIAT